MSTNIDNISPYEMNIWADNSTETDTLTSVDITGDGKKDKIETVTSDDIVNIG